MLIAKILKIQKVGEERENRNNNKKLLKNILKVHVATNLHPFPLKKTTITWNVSINIYPSFKEIVFPNIPTQSQP